MKPTLLPHLICPEGHADQLELTSEQRAEDGEILSGVLTCVSCKRSYPIRSGIPRFARGESRTAVAFGAEWLHYADLRPENDVELVTYLAPLSLDIFRDRLVLDAGCGMGKFAHAAARHGARAVIAADLSASIEVAYAHTRDLPHVHVIQADIYQLPLRQEFDLAYSIGVLHHLPDPEAGFRSVARLVRKGGLILAWVYGREGNALYAYLVEPLRKAVTSRLPAAVNRLLARALAFILWALIKVLYVPLSRISVGRRIGARLPYWEYFLYFHSLGWYFFESTVYDKLIAPIVHLYRRAEFAAWFRPEYFGDVGIYPRTGNSWRGHATVQATPAGEAR